MYEQIIDKVTQYEFLYNHNLKNYRNQNMRQEAWEEIGKKLEMSASTVKDMWAKLRNCYFNALKRPKTKSGQARKKLTPWKYEQEMSFLQPYLDTRQTQSNLPEGMEEPEPNELSCQSSVHDNEAEDDDDGKNDDNGETEISTPSTPRMQNKNTEGRLLKAKKRTPAEEVVYLMKQNVEYRMRKTCTKQQEIDDSDMFYLSMSKAAKKLPAIEQAKITMELCKIVSEAQIRILQSSWTPGASSTPSTSCSFRFSPSSSNDTYTSNLTPISDECLPEYSSASMWRV